MEFRKLKTTNGIIVLVVVIIICVFLKYFFFKFIQLLNLLYMILIDSNFLLLFYSIF